MRLHVTSFLVVLAASALTVSAAAHDFPSERSLLAQVAADRVEMMLVYTEPAGPRTDLLMAKFDIDGDGKLTGPEVELAEGELTRRAFHGLELEFLGESAGMHVPELKVTRTREGGLAAAFYLEYELNPALAERVFVVRVKGKRSDVVPLILMVEAGDGLDLVEASSRLADDAIEPAELQAGAEHLSRFVVEPSVGERSSSGASKSATPEK